MIASWNSRPKQRDAFGERRIIARKCLPQIRFFAPHHRNVDGDKKTRHDNEKHKASGSEREPGTDQQTT